MGWAFLLPDGQWEAGAVEKGGLVTPPVNDGFWCQPMADPNPRMVSLEYDAYKELAVPSGDVEAARRVEARIDRRYFVLVLHNCTNDTHDVLNAYGAHLPNPSDPGNWKPNDWFAKIPAPEVQL